MVTFDTIRLEFDLSFLSVVIKEIALNALDKIKTQYGVSSIFFRENVSPLEVEYRELKKSEDINSFIDDDGCKVTQKDKRFYYLPSYSYKFNLIRQNDVIVCEFSIPKYLFGHNLNVFPAVDYAQNLYCWELDLISNKVEQNICSSAFVSLVCLRHFLSEFCQKIFNVNFETLNPRLLRLDLSYNYRFSSRENFENFQRCMQKFFSQKVWGGRYTNHFNETFEKVTDDYSIKLYDKEKEFLKHDLNKLVKYFHLPFVGLSEEQIQAKLQDLQNFSHNVWRCELCVRSGGFVEMFFKHFEDFDFSEKEIYRYCLPYYRDVENFRSCVLRFKKNYVSGQQLKPSQLKLLNNIVCKYYYLLSYDVQNKCFLTPFDNNEFALLRFAEMVNFYFIENYKNPQRFFNYLYYENWEKCRKIRAGWSVRFYGSFSKTIVINDNLINYFYCLLKQYVNVVSQTHINNFEYVKLLRSKEYREDVVKILGRQLSPLLDFVVSSETKKEIPFYGYSKKQYNRNMQKLCMLNPLIKNYYSGERFNFSVEWRNTYVTTWIDDVDLKMKRAISDYKFSVSKLDIDLLFSNFLNSDELIVMYSYDIDEMFDFAIRQFSQFFAKNYDGLSFENFCDIGHFRFLPAWKRFESEFIEVQKFQN